MHTSGTLSPDNDAEPVILGAVGTSALGTLYSMGNAQRYWRNCVEIVGKVSPPDFVGNLTLPRARIQARVYLNDKFDPLGYKEDSKGGEMLRDYNPQPDGNIYDYDAPGATFTYPEPDGTVTRQRVNFVQYALYEEKNQTYQKASDDMHWFSRISVVKTQGADALATDVSGDNMAGKGTTPLTWDLK